MKINMKQQQGSMLVIALFIIIVMSLLAATLSRIMSSTADSVANEVYSAKAYYAAESGMEFGIYQILRNNVVCETFPVIAPTSDVMSVQLDISGEAGLENCTVEVTCQIIPVDGSNNQHYLTSTGICDGGKIVAQHQVEAEVKL